MIRNLGSTYSWYERLIWEVEQRAQAPAKGGIKDYSLAYGDPELGARIALLKVQAGKVCLIHSAASVFLGS